MVYTICKVAHMTDAECRAEHQKFNIETQQQIRKIYAKIFLFFKAIRTFMVYTIYGVGK